MNDLTDKLADALERLLSYNEDILKGRINYRPQDHIQVADEALTAYRAQRDGKREDKHRDWTDIQPTEDGVYLTKFDSYDEDSVADEFEVKGGKLYKDGEEWFSSGGLWKRKPLAKGEA